jgi:hypothetical protein
VLNCSWVANPWVNGTPTTILGTRLAFVKRECQFLTQDHLVDQPNAPILRQCFSHLSSVCRRREPRFQPGRSGLTKSSTTVFDSALSETAIAFG